MNRDLNTSLPLFPDSGPRIPSAMGPVSVEVVSASSILTKASGFVGDYDFTLNPYSGCAFGCTYCYAAAFSPSRELRASWGEWVRVKGNALELMRKRLKHVEGARIYMSSVTDPYQPIERLVELSRGLLELMVGAQPRLTIQTRSPLITRDRELLARFRSLKVNMTVTTDCEQVRRTFEPGCPSNAQRLNAVAELARSGLDVGVTMTPLLPVTSAEKFGYMLKESGAKRFVVQDFHAKDGDFVAGTRDAAKALLSQRKWDQRQYQEVVATLKRILPNLDEGRRGFAPP